VPLVQCREGIADELEPDHYAAGEGEVSYVQLTDTDLVVAEVLRADAVSIRHDQIDFCQNWSLTVPLIFTPHLLLSKLVSLVFGHTRRLKTVRNDDEKPLRKLACKVRVTINPDGLSVAELDPFDVLDDDAHFAEVYFGAGELATLNAAHGVLGYHFVVGVETVVVEEELGLQTLGILNFKVD